MKQGLIDCEISVQNRRNDDDNKDQRTSGYNSEVSAKIRRNNPELTSETRRNNNTQMSAKPRWNCELLTEIRRNDGDNNTQVCGRDCGENSQLMLEIREITATMGASSL